MHIGMAYGTGAGEKSVTEDDALHSLPDPAWQLLAAFSLPTEPGSEHQSVERVAGAVQELGLPPAQVKRLRNAVMEALREATRRVTQDQHYLPVIVRIWILDAYTQDPSPCNSEAQPDNRRGRRGWGFFLVQKQGDDAQASTGESHHVIELFLY